MDLNGILFPAPDDYLNVMDQYESEIIYIKKPIDNNDVTNANCESSCSSAENSGKIKSNEYIPALLLFSRYKLISKNFCIFFHGNAEDIFAAREVGDKIRTDLSMNVLIVEYPGYSIYQDDKNSDKVLQDSLIVFDFLTDTLKVEPEHIYVFGRSIGTAPTLYLASKRKPAGIFLMSPFTSVRAVAENLVGNVFKYLISERFTNTEYIKEVTCPILFIHGQLDTLIPIEHTIKLKELCQCPYEVIFPEEMNHNQFDYDLDLIMPLKDFLRRHTAFKTGDSTNIIFPNSIYEMPTTIKEMVVKMKLKMKGGGSCFGPCGNEPEKVSEGEKTSNEIK